MKFDRVIDLQEHMINKLHVRRADLSLVRAIQQNTCRVTVFMSRKHLFPSRVGLCIRPAHGSLFFLFFFVTIDSCIVCKRFFVSSASQCSSRSWMMAIFLRSQRHGAPTFGHYTRTDMVSFSGHRLEQADVKLGIFSVSSYIANEGPSGLLLLIRILLQRNSVH